MPFLRLFYSSPPVASADSTYFALLSDDLLKRVWRARTWGSSARSVDVFKARISHMTFGKSPFHHLIPDMFRCIKISMNSKSNITGNTVVIGKTCSMETIEKVLFYVGSVVQTLDINGTMFRKDKQKCARFSDLIVQRCTGVKKLLITWGEKESSAYENTLVTILKGLGPTLESLCITTTGRNPWVIIKCAGEFCTSLMKLTFNGYGLPLFPEEQWKQLGRTIQHLDLSNAHMWEHGLPKIIEHCNRLHSLRLGTSPLNTAQEEHLVSLYTSLSEQFVDVSFVDMKPAMCRQVVENCKYLARVAVIENDPSFHRMNTIAHRIHNLELEVDDTPNLELLNVATERCSNLEHLTITYKRSHPGLLTTFFSNSKPRLETLRIDHGAAPLSRSAVNAIANATGNLRELTLIVRELQEFDVLNALATSNRTLEKVIVSFALQELTSELALVNDEHIHLAVAVAKSFRNCVDLKEVIVEDRKIRAPCLARIRGEIEEAFVLLHLRGVRVRVFGGYIGTRKSHRHSM